MYKNGSHNDVLYGLQSFNSSQKWGLPSTLRMRLQRRLYGIYTVFLFIHFHSFTVLSIVSSCIYLNIRFFKTFLKSKDGKLYRLTLNIKSISYYVFISLFYKHITSLNKLSKTLSHCPKVYNSLFLLLFYYIIYLEAKVRFEKCVILNSPCCFRTEGGPILNSTFRWI